MQKAACGALNAWNLVQGPNNVHKHDGLGLIPLQAACCDGRETG